MRLSALSSKMTHAMEQVTAFFKACGRGIKFGVTHPQQAYKNVAEAFSNKCDAGYNSFKSTWFGNKCVRVSKWLKKWIIDPFVRGVIAYKDTLAVLTIVTAILVSVPIPPVVLIAVPVTVAIIVAYFETKHNRKKKAEDEALLKDVDTLKREAKEDKETIKELAPLKNKVENLEKKVALLFKDKTEPAPEVEPEAPQEPAPQPVLESGPRYTHV